MLDALRRANVERQFEWWEGEPKHPLFAATELGGEVGEALNVVKKLVRLAEGHVGSSATVSDLANELADVIICADLLAQCYGIDLTKAVPVKFNATSEKYGLKARL